MLHYIALDTSPVRPVLYDSYHQRSESVHFGREGARSYLQNYLNREGIQPLSIYESDLPNRRQLICWYFEPEQLSEESR